MHHHIGIERSFPLLGGYVVCDKPNSELYEFRGNLNSTDSSKNKYSSDVLVLTEY